jgi:hypothetical protein
MDIQAGNMKARLLLNDQWFVGSTYEFSPGAETVLFNFYHEGGQKSVDPSAVDVLLWAKGWVSLRKAFDRGWVIPSSDWTRFRPPLTEDEIRERKYYL